MAAPHFRSLSLMEQNEMMNRLTGVLMSILSLTARKKQLLFTDMEVSWMEEIS